MIRLLRGMVIPLDLPIRTPPDTVPVNTTRTEARPSRILSFRLPSRPMPRQFLLLIAALALLMGLSGCRSIGLGGSRGAGVVGTGAIVSETESRRLDLRLPERAVIVHDRNTADVYLTDLSPATLDRIAQGRLTGDVSGTLVHIHIFLSPRAGRTPISDDAASATARIVVVARGQVGVYDAAGFLMPGNSLRRGYAAGTLRNAPTRLTRATDGFDDLLGSGRTEIRFGANPNDEAAERIARAVRLLALAAEPVAAVTERD